MSGFVPSDVPIGVVISGTSYTLGGRDFSQCLVFTSGSAIAVTLPAPGNAGDLYGNWNVSIFAQGAGTVTITPSAPVTGGSTPTINGSSSATVTTGNSRHLFLGNDGNWYAPPGA